MSRVYLLPMSWVHTWSSFPWYLTERKKRPPWLRVDRYIGEYGIKKDNANGRRLLAAELALRCVVVGSHAEEELWKGLRKGWQFGDGDFAERLEEKMGAQEVDRLSVFADVCRERDELRARRIIEEELNAAGLEREELAGMKKTDARKIRIAIALRKQTPMSMRWIAKELSAGTPATVWEAMRKYEQQYKPRD